MPPVHGVTMDWLEGHQGEVFSISTICKATGRSVSATSRALADMLSRGVPAGLVHLSRYEWTYRPGEPALHGPTGNGMADLKAIRQASLRVVKVGQLRLGTKAEIVGTTDDGITVARDPTGRLWAMTPLKTAT